MTDVVILGAGYTGRFLYRLGRERGLRMRASSRAPDTHLADLPLADRVEFDLARPETWRNVPANAALIWCFPASPVEAVAAFTEQVLTQPRRLVVLGSTSAYDRARVDPIAVDGWIDESSPIDLSQPRVQGEEYLRRHHRAIVLRVAGIYGPGRNVLDWIRRGRVGPSPTFVNLVHVEDLAAICLRALEQGRPGEIYNVSDGQPRRWMEICEIARRRWDVAAAATGSDKGPGKRISNAKLCQELQYTFRYPDLYAALEEIESPPNAAHERERNL